MEVPCAFSLGGVGRWVGVIPGGGGGLRALRRVVRVSVAALRGAGSVAALRGADSRGRVAWCGSPPPPNPPPAPSPEGGEGEGAGERRKPLTPA
ncbi:hypothetical protein Srufu_050020 [Streptomyces libani subsp. rufus]|nr:hypothetical protein Srufu_050020 [Streptomyces libani subsp. rufus]